MDSFRLPLFPEGSLSSSVITTVFVGVWVVCFFNLRLGWSFSGLVVPGYLAPLFMANPWAGAVVCAEGVVTYLIVWVLSERLGRGLLWCNIFGRDRFFALVLTSIGVRLAGDIWLLPLAGAWVNATFGTEFDHHNNLHSYGLIVVALLANQLWKPGLVAGVGTAGVTLGLTYLFVRYVLMTFTNFSVGNLQYMYEDIAASLLASPKSYIILVTTAYLASRMNLRYSWEFNGILVPALMALQWFEPLKILMTVVEASVIYALAGLLLRAPVLRGMSFEGAQKLMLFFTVGFGWKMALGFLLPHVWPEIRPTDYFGFGYLLSTLLALKAHDKGIVVRMASATFQISLVGAVTGSLIGFALTLIPRPAATARPDLGTEQPAPARLSEAVEREKLATVEGKAGPAPDAAQRAAFVAGVRDLLAYARTRGPALL
ncbi:MAG: poly-gamma-glutamate biosynthesis protein PgsC/CapC, partial [Gemmataceae bacterium]